MTPRIEALKQYFVLDKAHHAVRVPAPGAEGAPYRDAALPAHRRSALRLKAALEAETPVIFPEERIVATRTRPRPARHLYRRRMARDRKPPFHP